MLKKFDLEAFEAIWQVVKVTYCTGYCVSERGLQATLYGALSNVIRDVDVVVEPSWEVNGAQMIPDLVVVERGKIRDIFELKFVPHDYADAKEDVRKLVRYGADVTERYPVRLDPSTGRWISSLPLSSNCGRHFVVVSKWDAAAVWPKSIRSEVPDLPEEPRICLWFGRIGIQDAENLEWGIERFI